MTLRPSDLAVVLLAASLQLPAAGCQFRPNPLFIPPTVDLATAASAPPQADLSSPPPTTTDLASSVAPPGNDLASPCTRVTESFAADPSPRWTMMGDAGFDPTHGGLQLTALGFNAAGSAFYDLAIPGDAFDAAFTFRIADGSGADGLAFVVAKAPSAASLPPYGNGAINAGYGLGYLGMDGFAVEIDTFMNVGNGDPNGNHVALVRTSDGAHLVTGTPASPLRSTTWHAAHVRVTSAHLTVEIDGAKTLDGDLPSGFSIPSAPLFFGFTGASSAFNDRHDVRDLTLTVGPSATCL